jgi:Holliday junction resolvasome RuvABC endonuclease subunit
MKILALDFGTKCGWAIGTPGNEISGTENFKSRASDSRGMVFVRFDRWINEMLCDHKPALVVHERPHLRGRAASEVLNGMLGFMVKACRVHGVQYSDCASTTLKKFATGKGNASKEKMMEAYREKWKKDPISHDEADARWLLEWAQNEFG